MELILDCRNGMDAIHTQFAEALNFPAWYGRNLDALHDCLTTVTTPIQITLIEPQQLPALCRVLKDCAAENTNIQL